MNMALAGITLDILHPPHSMFFPVGADRPVMGTIYQRKLKWFQYPFSLDHFKLICHEMGQEKAKDGKEANFFSCSIYIHKYVMQCTGILTWKTGSETRNKKEKKW